MKRFHQLVVDERLEGAGALVRSDPRFNRVLAMLTDLTLTVRADSFDSNAQVAIILEESPDNTVFSFRPPVPLFLSELAGATSPAQAVVRQAAWLPSAEYMRILAFQAYSESQNVSVRIWASGYLCTCSCGARSQSSRNRLGVGTR
jgi:hypothetical protein